ncbi:MAG: hypothetical protein ACN2B6_11080 [Rickettsiales bacterium]
MSTLMSDKKERKKAQVKKNRKTQEIFNFIRLKRQEEARVEGLKKKSIDTGDVKLPSDELTDKVMSVRNRLTHKKRISRERWNRFSGTSGAGGRGL